MEARGGGVIGFEKKAMLAQEEINCILEVFRRFARRFCSEILVKSRKSALVT